MEKGGNIRGRFRPILACMFLRWRYKFPFNLDYTLKLSSKSQWHGGIENRSLYGKPPSGSCVSSSGCGGSFLFPAFRTREKSPIRTSVDVPRRVLDVFDKRRQPERRWRNVAFFMKSGIAILKMPDFFGSHVHVAGFDVNFEIVSARQFLDPVMKSSIGISDYLQL